MDFVAGSAVAADHFQCDEDEPEVCQPAQRPADADEDRPWVRSLAFRIERGPQDKPKSERRESQRDDGEKQRSDRLMQEHGQWE